MNDKLDINILNKIYKSTEDGVSIWVNLLTYSYEKTALFAAIEKGNIEILKLLLMNDKLDINILNKIYEDNDEEGYDEDEGYDNNEKTALYAAIENNNIEIIKLLLANDKLDINTLMLMMNAR